MTKPESELDQILKAGDRVEFKAYLKRCTLPELIDAWIKASHAQVQDFQYLAFDAIRNHNVQTRC
jgi:hypothetical protein